MNKNSKKIPRVTGRSFAAGGLVMALVAGSLLLVPTAASADIPGATTDWDGQPITVGPDVSEEIIHMTGLTPGASIRHYKNTTAAGHLDTRFTTSGTGLTVPANGELDVPIAWFNSTSAPSHSIVIDDGGNVSWAAKSNSDAKVRVVQNGGVNDPNSYFEFPLEIEEFVPTIGELPADG